MVNGYMRDNPAERKKIEVFGCTDVIVTSGTTVG